MAECYGASDGRECSDRLLTALTIEDACWCSMGASKSSVGLTDPMPPEFALWLPPSDTRISSSDTAFACNCLA